jgi:hypothetical protein
MSVVRRVGLIFDRLGGFIEEPEVARYVTLPGGAQGFTIPDEAGGQPLSDRHFQDLHAPGLIPRSLPVLMFRTSDGGTSRFSVRLNQTPLVQHTLTGREPSPLTWHEVLPAGALRPESNELVFGVPSGGRVHFSDVVILYRSNKLTVRKSILEPPIAHG